MQNNYYIDHYKYKLEYDKRKKDELLSSNFFKLLEKENKNDYDKIMNYMNTKTYEEIENIFNYIINKKSVQKTKF